MYCSIVELRGKFPSDLIIRHLAEDGVNNEKELISVACSNNIPIPVFGVPKTINEDFLANYNSDPIIAALYSELDNPVRRQTPAFDALLRYCDALGNSQFEEVSQRSSSERERNLFAMLRRQHDGCGEGSSFGATGKINGRLPPDGISFGIVPNTIINKLGKII